MQVGRIRELPGTVVIEHGKSQGYFGLPVRHGKMNDKVTGPDTCIMETAWFPTPREIQDMIAGAPVICRLVGFPLPGMERPLPPPMNMYVGDRAEETNVG